MGCLIVNLWSVQVDLDPSPFTLLLRLWGEQPEAAEEAEGGAEAEGQGGAEGGQEGRVPGRDPAPQDGRGGVALPCGLVLGHGHDGGVLGGGL